MSLIMTAIGQTNVDNARKASHCNSWNYDVPGHLDYLYIQGASGGFS